MNGAAFRRSLSSSQWSIEPKWNSQIRWGLRDTKDQKLIKYVGLPKSGEWQVSGSTLRSPDVSVSSGRSPWDPCVARSHESKRDSHPLGPPAASVVLLPFGCPKHSSQMGT